MKRKKLDEIKRILEAEVEYHEEAKRVGLHLKDEMATFIYRYQEGLADTYRQCLGILNGDLDGSEDEWDWEFRELEGQSPPSMGV